jgi:hypothetical protein
VYRFIYCYAEYNYAQIFMLSVVAGYSFLLIAMLNDVILCVDMLIVVKSDVIMLNVVMLFRPHWQILNQTR